MTEEETPTPLKRPKPGPAERARRRAERAAAMGEAVPERPPAPRASGARRSRIETRTGAMLVQLNLGFTMTCAIVQQAGGPLNAQTDPLQPNEIYLLAHGIALQAESHAQFRKYLEYLLNVSGSAGLVSVLVAIIATRMAQHGVLPEQVGQYAQLALMADPKDIKAMTDSMTAPAADDAADAA